jgi:excisionase family DNA binding protein
MPTQPRSTEVDANVAARPLTPDQVAAHLGLHRDTVWRMVKRGELRAERIGGRFIRIPASELDRFH